MKYYFQLQLKRFHRIILAAGLSPIIAFILTPLLFVAGSMYIFSMEQYSNWIYFSIGILAVFKLGNEERIELIKTLFKKGDYYKIRFIENSLISLPFIGYLIFEGSYLFASGLILISFILIIFNSSQKLNYTIPTPFKKIPFEFIVGFRYTFILLFIAAFLIFKSVEVGNFNLGLFGLGFVILLSLSYYLKPENEFFVWTHSLNSNQFLTRKIRFASIGYLLLTLPPFLALSWFFSNEWAFILGLEALGFFYLAAMVFAKYSAFPNEISLPQAVFLGLCVWFPPLLIIVIPFFYFQSDKKLKYLLE